MQETEAVLLTDEQSGAAEEAGQVVLPVGNPAHESRGIVPHPVRDRFEEGLLASFRAPAAQLAQCEALVPLQPEVQLQAVGIVSEAGAHTVPPRSLFRCSLGEQTIEEAAMVASSGLRTSSRRGLSLVSPAAS